ncbi:hypothetical protein PCYB_132870 [Plasmodium cynomolgi strain B]|uniref:Uncharacterized protein n=1 Tax=Plasmodium cynomolgi (strain B) TaxID=1120755 RepID=K6UM97_PLACD|nr:hypothetical protein PCYB_132870 [Plasmodium cynomolgi strain B]GAB68413.1 hypothetical protein PCYB_132870 [Plasmodium cynomolgi strain B]
MCDDPSDTRRTDAAHSTHAHHTDTAHSTHAHHTDAAHSTHAHHTDAAHSTHAHHTDATHSPHQQGRSYFHNFDGLFDVTVTTMCFLLLISSGDLKVFYQSEIVKTKNKEVEEIISQSLTVLRFSFQLFRTLTLFMHYARVKAPSENIDFSVLNLPHEEEEEDDDFVI